MKFRALPHCSVVVHEGGALAVALDGSLDAPEEWAPALLAHGVAPWPDEELAKPAPALSASDVGTMSRSAMLAALAALGETPVGTGTGDLRRALRRAIAARS